MAARPYLRLSDPTRDRHIRRGGDEYTHAFLSLLPMGQAWPKAWDCGSDSLLYRVHRGLAYYWGFVDGRAADLLERESDPRKTIELLPDWERAWGLPDPCFPDATTIAERQRMLVLYMTYLGGQSRQYYEKLLEWVGIKIQVKEFAPFMAGISRAGDTRPLARVRYDFVDRGPEIIYDMDPPTVRPGARLHEHGDIWINETSGAQNRWTGSAWLLIGPPIEIILSANEPLLRSDATPLEAGDIWIRQQVGPGEARQLEWDGIDWVPIEPSIQIITSKLPPDATSLERGDIWVHQTTGLRSQWDGSTWSLIDPPVAAGSVRVATIGNQDGIYNPATMTFIYTAQGPLIIDGIELQINDRVLFTRQATAIENGIYIVAGTGLITSEEYDIALFSLETNSDSFTLFSDTGPIADHRFARLVRSSDFYHGSQISSGMTIQVSRGATQANTTWQLTAVSPIVLNSTSLHFNPVDPFALRKELIAPGAVWVPRFATGTQVTVNGRLITVQGSYNSLQELQAARPFASEGDGYVVNGDLYIWIGTVFVQLDAIEAPDEAFFPPAAPEVIAPIPPPAIAAPQEAPGVTEELWAIEEPDTAVFIETISNKWINVGSVNNFFAVVQGGASVPQSDKVDDNFRWYIGGPDMRFYWSASVGHPQATWFRSGVSRAGEDHHLHIGNPEDTQCLLNRWKPAHTKVILDTTHVAFANPMHGTP